MTAASDLYNDTTKAPRASCTVAASLFASAALGASGAWARSSIIDVREARRLLLVITYTTDATSGTDGFAEIVPMRALTALAPAAGDATWFPFVKESATVTEATLAAGTLPTGTDFTGSPLWAKVKALPLVITTDAADNDTDAVQCSVEIDVTTARYVQLMAHEAGDTTNPGTLAISYSMSA